MQGWNGAGGPTFLLENEPLNRQGQFAEVILGGGLVSLSVWVLRKQAGGDLEVCFQRAIFLHGEERRVWGQRSVWLSVTGKGCIWGRMDVAASFPGTALSLGGDVQGQPQW